MKALLDPKQQLVDEILRLNDRIMHFIVTAAIENWQKVTTIDEGIEIANKMLQKLEEFKQTYDDLSVENVGSTISFIAAARYAKDIFEFRRTLLLRGTLWNVNPQYAE